MVTALKTSINILLVFLFTACTSVPDERMTPYVDFPETRELTPGLCHWIQLCFVILIGYVYRTTRL